MMGRTGSWLREKSRRKRARKLLIAVAVLVFSLPLAWTILASFGIHPDAALGRRDGARRISTDTRTWESRRRTSGQSWPRARYVLCRDDSHCPGGLPRVFQPRAVAPAPQGSSRAKLPRARQPPGHGVCYSAQRHDHCPFASRHVYRGIPGAGRHFLPPCGLRAVRLPQAGAFDFEEAARLGGASAWRTLLDVILPVDAPGIAATAIIVFVLNWNSFLAPWS